MRSVPKWLRLLRAGAVFVGVLVSGCQSMNGTSPGQPSNEAFALPACFGLDFAPNWCVEQTDLGTNRVAISLKRKRFSSGGDGEAMQVFQRQADQLARERGFGGYEILAFTEGVDSSFPIIGQRVSQGVVLFWRVR